MKEKKERIRGCFPSLLRVYYTMHTKPTLTLEEENRLNAEGVKGMAELAKHLQNDSSLFAVQNNGVGTVVGLEIKRASRKAALRAASQLITKVFPEATTIPCKFKHDTLLSTNHGMFLVHYRHGMHQVSIGLHSHRA